MSKTLYFFTDQFPYGKNETFIENEFPFLKPNFSKIIIIPYQQANEKSRIEKSTEIDVLVLPKNKPFYTYFYPFLYLFFYFEIIHIVLNFKLINSIKNIKISFRTLQYATIQFIQVKKLVNKNEANYFYSYWFNDSSITTALLKRHFIDSKSIVRGHGWDVYYERHQSNYLPFRKFVLSVIDVCALISQHGCDYLNTKTNFKFSSKIKLCRLGTSNNLLQTIKKSENEDYFQIISCSNIIPLKRIELIIESLAKINLSIQWIHFGTGKSEEKVKIKAKELLDNKPNIHYQFKGHLSNTELYDFYKKENPDLFINLSTYEGIPVSIMEAFSFGIPCIATDVGGTSEIVSNENGILISKDTAPEKISLIIENFLLQKKEKRDEIRQLARKTWEDNYRAEKNYSDFISLIHSK